LLSGSASGFVDNSFERLGVAHGEFGQNLAVQFDAGSLQAVDKAAVRHFIDAAGSVDSGDPESSEFTAAFAAIDIRMVEGVQNGLFGDLLDIIVSTPETLGSAEKFLFLASCVT